MSPDTHIPEDDEAAIRRVLEDTLAGLKARDAGAVARRYAPDARIANLAPPLLMTGLDERGLQAWLDSWDGPVETEPRDVALRVSGDLAVVYGLQRTSTQRGGEAAAWWSRVTLALARTPEGWRIVHLHESVPFHMDGGMRAAIDLEPETKETTDV